MPRIRVTTPYYPLSHAFAKALSDRGFTEITARVAPVDRCTLTHRRGVPFETVASALQALEPFHIDASDVAELDSDLDIDLTFGPPEALSEWEVTVFSDSHELASAVCAHLNSFGFRVECVRFGAQERNVLMYGGASSFARRLAAWCAARENVVCPEEAPWPQADKDIWLYVRDPAHAGKRPREIFPLHLVTDHDEDVDSLAGALIAAGYLPPRIDATLQHKDDVPLHFRFDAGPLGEGSGSDDANELTSIVQLWLDGHGVDRSRFPLEKRGISRGGRRMRPLSIADGRDFASSQEALEARLVLPMKAFRAGMLRPYAGSEHNRFVVRIATDDPSRVAQAAARIREEGFHAVEVVPLAEPFSTTCMRIGASKDDAAPLVAAIRDILSSDANLADLPGIACVPAAPTSDDDSVIGIELPFASIDPIVRETRLAVAFTEASVVLHSSNEAELAPALAAFADLGFTKIRTRRRPPASRLEIRYGGASPVVLSALADRLRSITGRDAELLQEWPADDKDVFVHLTPPDVDALVKAAAAKRTAAVRTVRVHRANVVAAHRTFVFPGAGNTLHVGDAVLEARGAKSPWVPSRREFEAWCLDETTSRTLQHVAWSVALAEPCLLEGPSGTSKTSCVRYLACLLDQPVLRLNLNGQTDAGELIGRFVPNTREQEKKTKQRGTAAGWTWQDGPIPRALREGWWVILDELNLAEPQIVERLNSLLEDCPSLVVTENDSLVFGPQGEAVHPSFRIFATMNPQDYAGRAAMSPAFLDRWRGYLLVAPATEQDHLAFLRCAVFGEQPAVVVDGMRYRGQATRPAFPSMDKLPGVDSLLERLARFHVAAERSAEAGGSGMSAATPSTCFTRRALISVVRYLQFAMQAGQAGRPSDLVSSALHRYYLARAASTHQADTLRSLAEATGFEPEPAAVPETDSDPSQPVIAEASGGRR